MNFNTIKQELYKKIKKMSEEDFMRFIAKLEDIYYKNKARGNKNFHCGVEKSGFHAYNCNDCPNKCEEYYQWDKEMKGNKNVKENS